jgi:hypothetical protein
MSVESPLPQIWFWLRRRPLVRAFRVCLFLQRGASRAELSTSSRFPWILGWSLGTLGDGQA